MEWDKLGSFVDDKGTSFTKLSDDSEYDYKLIDKDGEDECTYLQMKMWDVKLGK